MQGTEKSSGSVARPVGWGGDRVDSVAMAENDPESARGWGWQGEFLF